MIAPGEIRVAGSNDPGEQNSELGGGCSKSKIILQASAALHFATPYIPSREPFSRGSLLGVA